MAKRHLNTVEGHSYVRANERLPVGGRIYFSSDENEGTVLCKMSRSEDGVYGVTTPK